MGSLPLCWGVTSPACRFLSPAFFCKHSLSSCPRSPCPELFCCFAPPCPSSTQQGSSSLLIMVICITSVELYCAWALSSQSFADNACSCVSLRLQDPCHSTNSIWVLVPVREVDLGLTDFPPVPTRACSSASLSMGSHHPRRHPSQLQLSLVMYYTNISLVQRQSKELWWCIGSIHHQNESLWWCITQKMVLSREMWTYHKSGTMWKKKTQDNLKRK